VTRADWEAATPKCHGLGGQTCMRLLTWTPARSAEPRASRTHREIDGVWCCPVHGPMLTGRQAAERSGWAPMRFAAEAA
jgi:hypothetical protein